MIPSRSSRRCPSWSAPRGRACCASPPATPASGTPGRPRTWPTGAAGWQLNEHHAYGIELEPPGKRVSRFSEAITIVRSLLAEESTTFHGEFYDFTDAPCDPKPVQSPLPLLVGTKGPRMLRITARHASEWNTWQAPDLAGKCRALAEACEKTGRDRATVWTSVNALIDLNGTGPSAGRTLAGSPQQVIDQLGQFADLGFDEFILPDWNLGASLGERADRLARLKSEVFDQLRG